MNLICEKTQKILEVDLMKATDPGLTCFFPFNKKCVQVYIEEKPVIFFHWNRCFY